MKITLMEKVYKYNKFVLYINGLVGVISDKSMINTSVDVLNNIGYSVVDVNNIFCLNDEVPNNESDYRNEAGRKAPVHLTETTWTHRCSNSCCYDHGCMIKVNDAVLLSQEPLVDELTSLLSKLGHTLDAEETEVALLSKPGVEYGSCLEYETDLTEEPDGIWMEINVIEYEGKKEYVR